MKGENTNCLECGTPFKKRNLNHKFCRKACRNKHSRRNTGTPEPSFLTKKKEKHNVASPYSPQNAPKQVFTAQYETYLKQMEEIQIKQESLLKRKKRQLKKHRNILTGTNEISKILSLTGLIGGAVAADSESETSKMAVFTIGGGLLGNFLGKIISQEISGSDMERLMKVEHKIQEIDIEINNLDQLRYIFKDQKHNISKYQPVEAPTLSRAESKKHNKNAILTARELYNKEFESIDIGNKYTGFLGIDLAPNFSMLVHGKAGSGKSTFCLDFANELSKSLGTCFYLSAEEGHSKTVRNKLRQNNITTSNIDLVDFKLVNGINQVEKLLKNGRYRFVFIDSINTIGMTHEKLEELKQKFNDIAFISILQNTKDGKFKGANEFAHNCDIVVNVEDGIAETTKNRYGQLQSHTIFLEKGAKIRKIGNKL